MAMSLARFNMIDPHGDASQVADRYRAMLEMASYLDQNGFYGLTFEEHHGVANGWSPTPMMNAAMIAARTENLSLTISALLLPLHDPIRVAEDLAVLDIVSRGRALTIFGLGYRPEEYALHGKDWQGRGQLMTECLEVVLKAWSGEPFMYRGQEVVVRPRPETQPHPTIFLGGTSRVAARRAAKFGLSLYTAANIPELEAYYNEKCQEYGTQGMCLMPGTDTQMLFVDEDPDKAWAELGEHFFHEASTYASWQTADISSAVTSKATNPQELREEGIYVVRTPQECAQIAARDGEMAVFSHHPLCGGLPIDRGWQSLQLFVDAISGV